MGAAKKIEPLFLTGKSDAKIIAMLHPLADKLLYFGCTHFTEYFIVHPKKDF